MWLLYQYGKDMIYQDSLIDQDRQAGHGARVAKGHYAIDGAYLHRLGPELLSVFERASIAWHIVCGIKSEGSRVKTEGKHGRDASQ